MQISRNSVDTATGPSDWFTGTVHYVTEGAGLCQRRGGPVEVIRAGDRVFFEPSEDHCTSYDADGYPASAPSRTYHKGGSPVDGQPGFIEEAGFRLTAYMEVDTRVATTVTVYVVCTGPQFDSPETIDATFPTDRPGQTERRREDVARWWIPPLPGAQAEGPQAGRGTQAP